MKTKWCIKLKSPIERLHVNDFMAPLIGEVNGTNCINKMFQHYIYKF